MSVNELQEFSDVKFIFWIEANSSIMLKAVTQKATRLNLVQRKRVEYLKLYLKRR